MDKKRVDEFREQLEKRSRELREELNRTEQDGRSADVGEMAQDIVDRATSSYQKEFLFNRSANVRSMLQMVDGALSRIREGNFGECISCGNDIEPKRIEAVPWTRHCRACQEKLEQGILEQETGT